MTDHDRPTYVPPPTTPPPESYGELIYLTIPRSPHAGLAADVARILEEFPHE